MTATFNKFSETKKTALCAVKVNSFELGNGTYVYLDGDAVREVTGEEKPDKGTRFDLPEGGRIIDLEVWNEEEERTEKATSKSGDVLQTITWS